MNEKRPVQLRMLCVLLLVTLAAPPAMAERPVAEAALACDSAGSSQYDMNACAGAAAGDADAELNRVYQQVLAANAADRVFIDKLKAAQRAWLVFRDAHMASRYPDPANAGTVYPMCASGELEALTRQRTAQLRQWLQGVEEGDVCAGSYPVRD